MPAGPSLQLTLSPIGPQPRWAVLLRPVLALPQFLAVSVLGVIALFATVGGWVVALLTGRNPAHRFVVGWLRALGRAGAYSALLSSTYPHLTLAEDPSAETEVRLEPAVLRRVTVLLRGVLALPALLLATVLAVGMVVPWLVAWILTLLRGELPAPLARGFAVTWRFQLRTLAYLLVVQEPYPSGLRGDPAEPPLEVGAFPSVDRSRWELRGGGWVTVGLEALCGLATTALLCLAGVALVTAAEAPGPLWAYTYRPDVAALPPSAAAVNFDLIQPVVSWDLLSGDCDLLAEALAAVSTDPPYPDPVLEAQFALGQRQLRQATLTCAYALAQHRAASFPVLRAELHDGAATISQFLGGVPIPSGWL